MLPGIFDTCLLYFKLYFILDFDRCIFFFLEDEMEIAENGDNESDVNNLLFKNTFLIAFS